METTRAMWTAEQLLALPESTGPCELVRGELVREPSPGAEHGWLAARVCIRIGGFVDERKLGLTFGAETGFVLRRDPDTVRAPDFAFVRRERIGAERLPRGYLSVVPDLIFEVMSPSDRLAAVREKIADWLASGTTVAVVVDPVHEAVFVHRANAPVEILATGDTLRAEDVLPGFALALTDLFAA